MPSLRDTALALICLLAGTGTLAAQDIDIPSSDIVTPEAAPPPGTEAPASPVAAPPASSDAALDVQVRAAPTQGPREALVRSSEAVTVVRLDVAKRRAQDMGDVLSRTAGVMLVRSGGLGSYGRFSINGLYDDQIRFFLDGVPLEYSGFTQGIANIPTNLFDKVVVYRGVLPIRLGSDALGGAVNLLTDDHYETGAEGSYQRSSFGTHRATLGTSYRHEPTGFVVRGRGFFDITRNDYPIDVTVNDARGRPVPATVKRFHDHYRAYGMSLEAGLVDKSWAKVLLVRAFHTDIDSDLQNNRVMTIPYGEVTYGDRSSGATARYENTFARKFKLESVATVARRRIDFSDESKWIYNWRGRLGPRPIAGEVDNSRRASNRSLWDESAFGRVFAEYPLTLAHVVRASITPTFTTRTGDERLQADPNTRDPLTAKRNLFTFISGLEYEANFFEHAEGEPSRAASADDHRVRNTLFGKSYVYKVDSQEVLPGGAFLGADQLRHHFGAGDALRYTITPYLQVKASYELTTRLPRPDEVFGNGVLILENLALKPETSHNINVGPHVEVRKTALGAFSADVNFFVRNSKNLIFLLGGTDYLRFRNVLKARSIGVESMFEWTSPGRYVATSGGFTLINQRNTSTAGAFESTRGDRIPSRPWLTSFWTAQLHFEKLLLPRDALEPYYYGRYVHKFYRGWESQGEPSTKATVPTQVTHALGISYYVSLKRGRLSASTEIQNLTDARVYDLYGVQRPGRAYFLKITGTI